MRHPLWLVSLVLCACGSGGDGEGSMPSAESAAPEDRVECALAGSKAFAHDCFVERGEGGALTLRHPDGGFRRLLVTDDGRGVVAADGAAPAQVQVIGEKGIEVAIEGDRYRLPATIKRR